MGTGMDTQPEESSRPDRVALSAGLRAASIYAVLGVLWILFSDQMLIRLVDDPVRWISLQTYKGWLFVTLTAGLLGWLVARQVYRFECNRAQVQRLNRTYRMLSGINEAILRVRNRDELLKIACELAISQGGFLLARIALRSDRGTSFRIAQFCGRNGSNPTYAQLPLIEGVEHASKDQVVLLDWHDRSLPIRLLGPDAAQLKIRSIAALPILDDTNKASERGWLELFSSARNTFDEQELALLREITGDIGLGLEMIEKSEELHSLTNYDALTGLPNESLLFDRFSQAIARAHYDKRCVGVMVTDVPELIRIEDLHGQRVGDQCRKTIAEYLVGVLRDGDTAARTGRREFTLLLTDMARSSDLIDLSQRILQGPAIRIDGEQSQVQLALRGGASLYPDDAETADDLLRYATLALHSKPIPPGSCNFYSAGVDAMAQQRLHIEHGLNHALERGELSLVYQLLVDSRTQKPVGCETLLRWHSETLGEVSPATFIPVAEETGAIHVIGDWVLEQACHQRVIWQGAGVDSFYVSVNVAPPQLLREGFIDTLTGILERTGVKPISLVLEVTETAFLHDMQRAEAVLHTIRELGVRIYLDDFGTGYSSLSYLNRLPIDALKIDRSFIREVPGEARAGSLVKSIIALAHSLGIKVIAEGVEAPSQLRYLSYLDCDFLQGYLFSRPGTPEMVSGSLLAAV